MEKVTDVRRSGQELEFRVLWEACEETDGKEVETWEPEAELVADKMGRKIAGFWRSGKGKERKRQFKKSGVAEGRRQ